MTSVLVLLAGGAAAGVFGSLLGLGGGILIVPLLALAMGLPLREAVAISLVAVIVTSSASAAVYLQRHVANLRLGMTLELFSATGALVGGLVAFLIDERLLAGLFAALLIWVAISMARRKDAPPAPRRLDHARHPGPGRGRGARRPGPGRRCRPPPRLSRSRPPPSRRPASPPSSRVPGTSSTGSPRAWPARCSPASTPRCSASAAAWSRCRSCTS